MKIKRLGGPVVWDGLQVDPGDTIDVSAEVADSLLSAGCTADGEAVAPQWAKTTKSTSKASSSEEGSS